MSERRSSWSESSWQDVRYAARGIRLRPGFAAVVVATLALGIGANAIMFGVVDRLLLRPPAHVVEPERVARMYFREKAPAWLPNKEFQVGAITTYPVVAALRENVPALEEVAAFSSGKATLGRGPEAEEVSVSSASGNFFRLLGVRPALGRFFAPEEDRPPVGAQVAVLSHSFWRRHFGAERTALGQQLLIENKSFTVIGVAPKGFNGVNLDRVDVWLPLSATASDGFGKDWHSVPNAWWLTTIGRLAPGATRQQVEASATLAFRNEVRSWKRPNRDTLGIVIAGSIIAARGPDETPRSAKVSLWLVGVSAIVLLIACANIANLLLARAVQRRREIAVRLALGVGRGRLVRQLLTESLLLALLACAAALLVAHWGGQAVRAVLLPSIEWGDSPVDLRVLTFTALATVVTGILAGLAPAVQASATDVAGSLKAGVREGGARRSRLRSGLLVAQAALSVVLLVGAGLFVRSLSNVRGLDVGIDLDRVLLARMELRRVGFEPAQIRDLYRTAAERVRQLPGVENTALVAASIPMRSATSYGKPRIPGIDSLPPLPNGGPYQSAVSPDYFATLGTRITRGRGITPIDEATRARVAVINETVAKHYFPDKDPIGQCIIFGPEQACTEIVGVVQNVVLFRMVDDERGLVYMPMSHPLMGDPATPGALLIRAAASSPGVATAVRREIQALAPNMPFVGVQWFEQLVAPEMAPWRLGATMFGVFGALALVIAAVGLYSVIAYSVSQRTHEIGVRMALGARDADVVRLILVEGTRLGIAGLALGLVVALVAGRWMEPLLYATSPRDPLIFALVAVTLTAVAVAASLFPAWRASRVSPAVALRAE